MKSWGFGRKGLEMSSSDFTFRQAERLVEELKIVVPTVEKLLNQANEVKSTNDKAFELNKELEVNLINFNGIIKEAISDELEPRLRQIDELNDLESRLNKNVSYLKRAAENSRAMSRLNCLIIVCVAVASTFYYIKGF